ncbi:hypothetical protein KEM56_000684 [Ascosphaera pollenicola]|nr:hypothetical protein KEM56_000684 [Ascosphaera pollenicola]
MSYVIKVPCSSANIGPGFDVLGLALSIYLELHVTTQNAPADAPLNCTISYEGEGADEVTLVPDANLITRVALYVLRCHDHHAFPEPVHVHVKNPIPLGRGLGSSGAAVTAGVMLGNEVGKLGLSKARMLDYCLMIERHPDNVAAALYGGFVGTYLNELRPEDLAWKEIPLSEVLPAPAGGLDTGRRPPEPPMNIGHYKQFPWSKKIKAITIIPDFELMTAKAREVLPEKYTRADVVYNLQRAALLPTVLNSDPLDPDTIYLAMQDKVHQPYRKTLIPGLTEILNFMTPSTQPGLLGICLSGAGPTILALATHNFDEIAKRIIAEFEKNQIQCRWELLEPAENGAVVENKKI